MRGNLRRVLAGRPGMGSGGLAALTFLSEAERSQVLTAWNASPEESAALAAATPASLLGQLERQAAATPDAVAVVCDSRALTYAALHRRADQLAPGVRGEGGRPEVAVAGCGRRRG